MRPGVPTTMSAPPRIRCTCMNRLTPPRIATTQLLLAAERVQAFLDLQGQFAGRRQDQGTCPVAARLAGIAGEVLQHRQRESGGFAGAGLGDAEQIASRRAGAEWQLSGLGLVERSAALSRARNSGSARPSVTKLYAPACVATGSSLRQ